MHLTAILTFMFPLNVFAQVPDTLWTRTYGGPMNEKTWGRAAQQTNDGGYVIFGHTNSYGAGGDDIYIVKTDGSGDTVWTKTYGGTGMDRCYAGLQTSDGGFFVAAWTASFGADSFDIYILKLNNVGDTIWTNMFGGIGNEWISGAEQTSDGGFILTGYTTSYGAGSYDIYLIKTDVFGDTLWTKTYGGPQWDQAYEVHQTSDGNYLLAAWTQSYGAGNYDAYILKTDSYGDSLWAKTYGGSDMDKACDIFETSDGYYLVVGWTYSFGAGYNDAFLLKTNTNGDSLWTKLYGGPYPDGFYSIKETIDSNFIITGLTSSNCWYESNACLIKVDMYGDTIWATSFGGDTVDFGYSVEQTSDYGYMLAGYTESYGNGQADFYLIKTAPDTTGIYERNSALVTKRYPSATIVNGPIVLPTNKQHRLIDITGRVVTSTNLKPGIYFIEIEGVVEQKVIKIE